MPPKRQRSPDKLVPGEPLSLKRPKVDLNLAYLWEQLSDENENVRLDGVYQLLTVRLTNSAPENSKTIIRRLFRGLCSSRKNARQGFYVALVGALSLPAEETGISLTEIISILETQTTPESGVSGQEERDHHFGRLLGCKALLESEALWASGSEVSSGWDRTLDILCKLMAQKPWIRSEGSFIICSAVSMVATLKNPSKAVPGVLTSHLLQRLKQHKLLRTIDGVGIWLTIRQSMPDVKLPKNIWISEDPLHKKELRDLKKVLLGKREQDEQEEEELLGSSVWSPKLHPTWQIILRQLDDAQPDRALFEEFWSDVVDGGLFDASSTPERKHIGLVVLGCALKTVEISLIPSCFTRNLMACLVQSLQNPDETYLAKAILKVFEEYGQFAKAGHSKGAHNTIIGLLQGSDYADFDSLTKTDIITSLFDIDPLYQGSLSGLLIRDLRDDPKGDRPLAKVAARRKNILSVFSRAMCQAVRGLVHEEATSIDSNASAWNKVRDIMKSLFHLRAKARAKSDDMVDWDEATYTALQEKIALMLETILAVGTQGGRNFLDIIAVLQETNLAAEASIEQSLDTSWEIFNAIVSDSNESSIRESQRRHALSLRQGLGLLLALLLHEVYDGNVEAVEMLQDAISIANESLAGQNLSRAADQVLEIIISFMSKPSKFRRRVCTLIFEAFALHISFDGIDSISHILKAKESRDGQDELFQSGEGVLSEELSDEEGGMESSSSLDSDVEVESADGTSDEGEEIPSSDDEISDAEVNESATSEPSDLDDQDEELTRFEGALAAALRTRKLNESDTLDLDTDPGSDATSDSDMSDSEMMELDEKLADVFRNQRNQLSAQKLRKEEVKNAKENVINLKNRGMDLIELFFRSQHSRGTECAELLVAVLQMVQMTTTQQLASRGTAMVKNYASRHKGAKLPTAERSVAAREKIRQSLQSLLQIVAHKDASNSLISVAGQVNILLCKLLVQAGEQNVEKIVADLSDEHGFGQDMKRKAHEAFWSRYDAWAELVRERRGGKQDLNGDQSKAEQAASVHRKTLKT